MKDSVNLKISFSYLAMMCKPRGFAAPSWYSSQGPFVKNKIFLKINKIINNLVYYYFVSFKGEREPAYASRFAIGTRANEKIIYKQGRFLISPIATSVHLMGY